MISYSSFPNFFSVKFSGCFAESMHPAPNAPPRLSRLTRAHDEIREGGAHVCGGNGAHVPRNA